MQQECGSFLGAKALEDRQECQGNLFAELELHFGRRRVIFNECLRQTRSRVFNALTLALPKAIKAKSCGDGDQECNRRLYIASPRSVPAQVDILNEVLRVSPRAEHAVGNAEQSRTM